MNNIKEAIDILKKGGIVVFPTDTAFGIGCRMDDEQAVERLFTLRRRPRTQATPVLVSSVAMASTYFSSPLPDNVRRLCNTYWPGGLTVIYHCKVEKTPPLVRGGGTTLGMRMPDHDIPLALIRKVGIPLLGPSANFHGGETPYTYEDLDTDLLSLVDFVIPGMCKGALQNNLYTFSSVGAPQRAVILNNRNDYLGTSPKYRLASTIVDCTKTPFQIVRQGAVKIAI